MKSIEIMTRIMRSAMALSAALLAMSLTSCFKEPKVQGYLGEGIHLQGADTMYVAIGSKAASSTAWLDNSTRPCTFRIENVRNRRGERVEGFFRTFPARLWNEPYDYLTDKTMEQVLGKLTDAMLTPLMINSVNGQLRAMESTAEIGIKPGDVFHVDVSVSNSKGTAFLEDYAIIKFESGETQNDFVLTDLVNGICITNAAGEATFPYYDQINQNQSNFTARRENIYTDNGREPNLRIRKVSDEPSVGIKVFFKFYDKNGTLFDPADYATYSTTESYIDHGVSRVDSMEDGMLLEFPVTPWPVNTSLYSYLRGAVYNDFSNLDVQALKAANKAGTIPFNAAWPSDDYAGSKGWYIRIRSMVTFYQPGTYEFVCKVPYTVAR